LYIIYALAIQIGIYSRQALFRDIQKKNYHGLYKKYSYSIFVTKCNRDLDEETSLTDPQYDKIHMLTDIPQARFKCIFAF